MNKLYLALQLFLYHPPKQQQQQQQERNTQHNIYVWKQQKQNKIIRHLKNFYIIWYFFNKVIYIMTTVMNIYNKAFMSKIIIKKEAKAKVTITRRISKSVGRKRNNCYKKKVIKEEIRLYISCKIVISIIFPICRISFI